MLASMIDPPRGCPFMSLLLQVIETSVPRLIVMQVVPVVDAMRMEAVISSSR